MRSRFQERGPIAFPGGAQGAEKECDRVGHTEPTARGTCYRCGQKVPPAGVITDSRAIEYSKLRSSGLSVDEATRQVFGEMSCTEATHRFHSTASDCACGTTKREMATAQAPVLMLPNDQIEPHKGNTEAV